MRDDGPPGPRLVRDFLEESAGRTPGKTALVADRHRLTYAQIEAESNRFANALISLGLRPGDRAMVLLPNSVEAVVSIFGISKASAVFCVVNESVKPRKLLRLLKDSGARALVTNSRTASGLLELGDRADLETIVVVDGAAVEGAGIHDYRSLLEEQAADRPARLAREDDVACLIYTSGSTGGPKGVVCGHDNVSFATWSITTYLENEADDVVVSGLPLSFDYGLYQVLMVFRFGGRLVLHRSLAFPADILRSIGSEGVTGLPGVPTFFALMLQLDLGLFDLTALRYVTSTAASFPPDHIRHLRSALPGVRMYSMYGLTECKRALYLPPEELDEAPDSVGRPIPGTDAWLVDGAGRRLGPGTEGELVIAGPHVMRGYWQDDSLTEAVFREGPEPGRRLLFTGDIMRMDAAGRFYFVGRKDDLIKTRGERVSPKEVEDVIYGLPGVVKAAVVGEPDPILGARLKAYVVSGDPELSEADVVRRCRRELEDFMVPSSVEMISDLPTTSSGKVDKTGL